jgi:hypothetical protein
MSDIWIVSGSGLTAIKSVAALQSALRMVGATEREQAGFVLLVTVPEANSAISN